MELCLGTAQFGMNYGIQGGKKIAYTEAFEILDYALKNGITTLDTASGYGNAETIIGDYIADKTDGFKIISKLPFELFKNLTETDYLEKAISSLEESLELLKSYKLHGLLLHNTAYLYDENAMNALLFLKEAGYTDSIGVSVYDPKDAFYALELGLDLIQIPANLFDRRFDPFLESAASKMKVYVRSVFLQGLLLMDPDEVTNKLPIASEYVKSFDQISKDSGFTRRELALAYIKRKKGISSLVFGVDSLLQLQENIAAFHKQVPDQIIDEISTQFVNINEDIISPLKWKN